MLRDHITDGFRFNKGLSWGCYVPVPECIYFFATPGLIVDSWPTFSMRPTKEELAHFTVVSGTFAHQYIIDNFLSDRPLGLHHFEDFVESSFAGLEIHNKNIGAGTRTIEQLMGMRFSRSKFRDKYVIKSLNELAKMPFPSSKQEDALNNYRNVHMGITKCILDTRLRTGKEERIPDYNEVLKHLRGRFKKVPPANISGLELLRTIQNILNLSGGYNCVNNGEAHRSTYNLLATLYRSCCLNGSKLPEVFVSLLNLYQPATLVPVITVVRDIETKEYGSKFFEMYMNYIPIEVVCSMKQGCLIERIKAKFLEGIKPYSDCMLGISDEQTNRLIDRYGIDKYSDIMFKSYAQVFEEILRRFFETVIEIEVILGRGGLDCRYCRSYFEAIDQQIDQAVKIGIEGRHIMKSLGETYGECVESTCRIYGSLYERLKKRYPWS